MCTEVTCPTCLEHAPVGFLLNSSRSTNSFVVVQGRIDRTLRAGTFCPIACETQAVAQRRCRHCTEHSSWRMSTLGVFEGCNGACLARSRHRVATRAQLCVHSLRPRPGAAPLCPSDALLLGLMCLELRVRPRARQCSRNGSRCVNAAQCKSSELHHGRLCKSPLACVSIAETRCSCVRKVVT